ncbi:TetR/AcrR family transcriptional regulator [Verticiella sediminum]|uniref:TetR/AcrR family transcriptional regulator n=1 Tax=Verticiella sediminum TaxID=1247510 RepID=A0A556A915_9BURK|nr:TetR/AcrR family transcriptional regulator [Verticiella sediminum]TSH89361.1 TetR/AcrR family transcriptional regulator [Verticiella sediminum]
MPNRTVVIENMNAPSSAPKEGKGRERILDAAEQLFAERGYDGCSLKDVAEKAAVNQGMIHYFFKKKDVLFKDVYLRRGVGIAAERLRLLDFEEKAANGEPLAVRRILELFLRPAFDVARSGPGGYAFVKILSRLHLDAALPITQIRAKLYDESTRRYFAALQRSLPALTVEKLAWRFILILGAYQYALGDTGRLEFVSAGRCSGKDFDAAFKHVIPFLVAGLQAEDDEPAPEREP